jgi:hypothetical protein
VLRLVGRQDKPLELKKSIYMQYFGFAHKGAGIVVLLALIAPIGFKIYINWLVGQSTKRAIYPDVLTFGVLYLFFTFLRGLILAFYFRLASS